MNEKKTILITGASGFLGFYLGLELATEFNLLGLYCRAPIEKLNFIQWKSSNLLETGEIELLLNSLGRVDMIVNLAAYSSVNFCEKFPALSHRLNSLAAKKMADYCEQKGILFLQISSDMVFSGSNAPYAEDDFVHPLSRYAQQKVEIEAYLSEKKQSFVSRLPLLYGFGAGHSNFLPNWLSKLSNNEPVEAFEDEFRTPLSGMSAAAGLSAQIRALLRGEKSVLNEKILHFGGKESISRYDFGKKMCNIFGVSDKKLTPTGLKNSPLAKLRPADVSFDSSLAAELLNFNPPSISEELNTLKNQQPPAKKENL